MGRAGRVNVKRKEVETRESIINQAQLRRPRGVRRRSKKLRRNVLDGADFVRDVLDSYPAAPALVMFARGIGLFPPSSPKVRPQLQK